jgi:hypothetical protein
MNNRYGTAVIALAALLPTYAAAQYRGNCSAICAQVESFARQSRGDWQFVQELQRLSNACQACQMQSRSRPEPAPPVLQQPTVSARDRQVANALTALMSSMGSFIQSTGYNNSVIPKDWNPDNIGDFLTQQRENNKINAPAPPPGLVESYDSKPNPNVKPSNQFEFSGSLLDPKDITHMSMPKAAAAPTTLPPPGQLGVNSNATGFQQETNVNANNQTWGQKVTNWFECSVLRRC